MKKIYILLILMCLVVNLITGCGKVLEQTAESLRTDRYAPETVSQTEMDIAQIEEAISPEVNVPGQSQGSNNGNNNNDKGKKTGKKK